MTASDIIRIVKTHAQEMTPFSVRRMAIFGSVARGEENTGSDVDILVAFEGETTFDRYFDLKFWLEDLLGCPVDLVTEKALRPEMADEVRREALHVAP